MVCDRVKERSHFVHLEMIYEMSHFYAPIGVTGMRCERNPVKSSVFPNDLPQTLLIRSKPRDAE